MIERLPGLTARLCARILALLLALPLALLATSARAETDIIELQRLDYVLSDSAAKPETGWRAGHTWMGWPMGRRDLQGRPVTTVWARMTFDRGQLPGGKLALVTTDNCDRLRIFLNGHEVFRNFADEQDQRLGWYSPYLVPLNEAWLYGRHNEIVVRIDGRNNLTIGRYRIGTAAAAGHLYSVQRFWHYHAVQFADFTVLVIAVAALLMWLARRQEIELLILAINGFAWGSFALFFVLDRPFIDPWTHEQIGTAVWFVAMVTSLAYMAFVIDRDKARTIAPYHLVCSTALYAATLLLPGRYVVLSLMEGYLVAVSVSILAAAGYVGLRRPGERGRMIGLLAMLLLCLVGAVHDVGSQWFVRWWRGLEFQTTAFAGFVFCVYFILAFGQRSAKAFADLEQSNQLLEQRVADARARLAESEALRREAEVARAVDSERTRIMREVHDGVGSNLVSALAAAEHSSANPATIDTIKRALANLRLAVDSLEPVEGDIVLLLASFRHRMEPGIKAAGWQLQWSMADLPPLPWLDTAGALDLLRICQEALANALTHSRGQVIAVRSEPGEQQGRSGITITLTDDGVGIAGKAAQAGGDRIASRSGKGLANMTARARALGGHLKIGPGEHGGTRLTLWLPLVKRTRPEPPGTPQQPPMALPS